MNIQEEVSNNSDNVLEDRPSVTEWKDVRIPVAHFGAIVPSILFTQEEVDAINWENIYGF